MPTDRRVRYTRMFLRESLIKFLQEKPIARITVKELCAEAEINRATFYAHFTDQFDLLKQVEAEYISAITAFLDGLAAESPRNDARRATEKILAYIEEHGDLSRVLLGANGSIDFLERVTDLLRARVAAIWRVRKSAPDMTADYLFTFLAEGSIGVVRRWLFAPGSPQGAQEIAHLIVAFSEQGLSAWLQPHAQ